MCSHKRLIGLQRYSIDGRAQHQLFLSAFALACRLVRLDVSFKDGKQCAAAVVFSLERLARGSIRFYYVG